MILKSWINNDSAILTIKKARLGYFKVHVPFWQQAYTLIQGDLHVELASVFLVIEVLWEHWELSPHFLLAYGEEWYQEFEHMSHALVQRPKIKWKTLIYIYV